MGPNCVIGNLLRHEYDRVDVARVWLTIEDDLAPLKVGPVEAGHARPLQSATPMFVGVCGRSSILDHSMALPPISCWLSEDAADSSIEFLGAYGIGSRI